MPVLRMGALMRHYIDNRPDLVVRGGTVGEALEDAVAQYPALRFHVLDAGGKLRRHINVFVNDENIRDLKGVDTPLQEIDRIMLMASISGGDE